jgi:hypothetical protein
MFEEKPWLAMVRTWKEPPSHRGLSLSEWFVQGSIGGNVYTIPLLIG